MRNKVTVQVYGPGRYTKWALRSQRTFKSRERAERWATKVLERRPTVRTRLRRETEWFADLKDLRGWTIEVEAPEVLVQSIGERGY